MQKEEAASSQPIGPILTKDFVLAFLVLFAFILAHYMLTPTLPIYLKGLGAAEAEIGVLVGAFGVSSLVLRLLVGQALLSYSERSIMMTGAFVFAITFAACMVLPLFWPLFVVRLFQGLSFAFLDTAVLAFVVRILPAARTGQGISYCLLAVNFSLALSPMLGMSIINRFDFTVLFIVGIVLSACALLFSLFLKGPPVNRPKASFSGGVFAINTKVIPHAFSSFFQNFIWGCLLAFVPLYGIERGVDNSAPFFTATAVMTIACRLFAGRIVDTWDREKIAMTLMAVATAACVALAFTKTLPVFVAVGVLWGIAAAFVFPALMAMAMERAGSSGGTAVGTFRALGDSGMAVGPMVMGLVIRFTNYPTMFVCLGLTAFVNLCYFYFFVRRRGVSVQAADR